MLWILLAIALFPLERAFSTPLPPYRFASCPRSSSASCTVCDAFFFFQAEDGIRDHCVTGVQTCALPIVRRFLVMDHVHLQSPRALQIQRAVVNEHAFLRRTLRYFQRDAEDFLFRLPCVQVTGAEKNLKILAQAKRLDSIVVQFQRLIINGCDEILLDTRDIAKQLPRLGILLRLSKHERGIFLAGKRPGPVKQGSVQILIQSDLSHIERGKRQVVPLAELFQVQLKGLGGFHPGIVVPAVRQNNPADVPKHCCDVRQGSASWKAIERYQKKDLDES